MTLAQLRVFLETSKRRSRGGNRGLTRFFEGSSAAIWYYECMFHVDEMIWFMRTGVAGGGIGVGSPNFYLSLHIPSASLEFEIV